jgi:arginine/ornithine transport system permease protein
MQAASSPNTSALFHGYLPSLFEGAGLTLLLALSSLTVAVLLGLVGASAKLSKSKLAQKVAMAYTTVIRGVPDLVLILLVFYGGQTLANKVAEWFGRTEGLDINPFVAGVATIGFIFGAYLTETFRAAMLAVPAGQRESAIAFGMTRWQTLRRIVLPQMVRFALPSFKNNWLVLLKSTALVSVIGLTDVTHKAGLAAGATREPFTFYCLLGLFYLAFTVLSGLLLDWLERRYSVGVKQAKLGAAA